MLGKLSAEEGQLERAQRTLRALLLVLGRSAPGATVEVSRGEVLFELALIAQKENDIERAEELVESALHASSENPHEAESFERALKKRGSFRSHGAFARSAFVGLPRGGNARRDFARSGRSLPRHEQARSRKSRLKGQADQTLRELKETPPAAPEAWTAMETVYEHLRESDKLADILALRVAAGAESESADYADVLYRLAKIRLAKRETIGEGTELLERALDIAPEPDRATEALTPAIEADDKNERVARLYERVTRGRGRKSAHAAALLRIINLGVATVEELREGVALALADSNELLATSILIELVAQDDLDEELAFWAQKALADLFIKSGDLARAADLKERAADVAATEEERRELLLEVAEMANGKLGDLPRAARIYAKLRDREPADRSIWEPLLAIYRTLGDTESVIALIADTLPLIESSKERNRLRIEEAKLLLAHPGAEQEAQGLLDDVLEDEPTHLEASMLLSDILERSGDKPGSPRCSPTGYRERRRRRHRHSLALRASRRAARGNGAHRRRPRRLPRVARLGTRRQNIAARDPAFVRNRRRFLRNSRGDRKAPDSRDRCRRRSAGAETLCPRSERGDAELAERALEAGLRESPDDTELSELLMQSYQARGAHRELAVLLRQAFDRSPDSAALLFALLDTYRNLGEIEAAVETVSLALEKAPGLAPLYRERAALFEALGRTGEALADFGRAYEIGGVSHLSDFVQALEREAAHGASGGARDTRLRLAQLLCQTGLVDQARTHLED